MKTVLHTTAHLFVYHYRKVKVKHLVQVLYLYLSVLSHLSLISIVRTLRLNIKQKICFILNTTELITQCPSHQPSKLHALTDPTDLFINLYPSNGGLASAFQFISGVGKTEPVKLFQLLC